MDQNYKDSISQKAAQAGRGKKLTVLDMKYWKQAEDNLYSEFSVLFNIPKDKVEAYIAEQIHLLKQSSLTLEAESVVGEITEIWTSLRLY